VPQQLARADPRHHRQQVVRSWRCSTSSSCVAGLFLHSAAAIILVVPIVMPLVNAVGIDPVHFGLVVTLNLAIGQQTPPVASVLMTACSIAKADIWEVASCDLRVCGESSRFGAPIARLGLTMSYEELEPLVQLLGASPVLDLLLSGELIGAERALSYGLVNRVHADAAVVEQGFGLAARIAAGAPLVNRWHKKFVRRLHERAPLSELERAEPHEAFTTRDYREGRAAFLEKREPRFRGE
jgi:enoyl-CoA hydratase